MTKMKVCVELCPKYLTKGLALPLEANASVEKAEVASTASLSTEGGRAPAEAPALPRLERTTHSFAGRFS